LLYVSVQTKIYWTDKNFNLPENFRIERFFANQGIEKQKEFSLIAKSECSVLQKTNLTVLVDLTIIALTEKVVQQAKLSAGGKPMTNRPNTAARKSTRPIHVATVATLVFFSGGILSYGASPHLLTEHMVATGLFFACMWVASRLFTEGLKYRLKLEDVDPATAEGPVFSFALYLEIVKHVVGVSFTLGWLAGVLLCWEKFANYHILVPFTASLGVSMGCFLITFGLTRYVDQLRWSDNED